MFAYIPARGGSKRIPRKNVRLLGGKPLLTHVIENLLQVSELSGIAVSSDDDEILKTARRFPDIITLAPRAPQLSGDNISFMDLVIDDVPRFADFFCDEDLLFCLPTAVFVEAIHYADAIRRFKAHPEGLVISVVEYSISPLLALTGNLNALNAVFPSYYETPTSQLPKAFADAGCFYVLRLSSAVGKSKLLDLNPVQGAILPPTVGVDLDTPADWEMLQKIYRSNDSRIT